MRKEIIYCDRCGKQIDGQFWYAELLNPKLVEDMQFDICTDCMANFMTKGVEPAPDPDEPKPKKSRKIDRGKVWALKDADWKVSAIAGEIGCSEATIYNILNEGRPS